jgi:O-antigen ligase
MTKVRVWLRTDATAYLSLVFVSIVISRMFQYFWPNVDFLKGQNPATTIQLVLIPVIVVIWVLYRPTKRRNPYLNIFLFALAASFLFQFSLGALRGELWSYVALLLPFTIVLLWIKPPSYRAVIRSTDVFCLALVGIAILSQIASGLGIVESRSYVEHRYFGLANFDLFQWRWEGPFGGVNFAGPAGAFLLVYGLTRFNLWRLFLVLSGGVFIIASESRGAFIGAAVGLLAWLIFREKLFGLTMSAMLKAVIGVSGFVLMIGGITLVDPTFNGRQQIWSDYLRLWTDSPLFGIPEGQLSAALTSGDVIFSGLTGHNLFIDTVTRSGVIGLALTFLAIAVVFVLAWKAYRRGMATGLIIAVTFIAGSMSESLTSWIYLSFLLVPLVIAALLSATWLEEREALAPGEISREHEVAAPSATETLT